MRDGDGGQFVICPPSPFLSLSSGFESNPYNPVGKPKSPDCRGMGLLESDR